MIGQKDSFAICAVAAAPLRNSNKDESEIVSQLLFGEAVRVLQLDRNWVRIKTEKDHYSGYMDPKQLFPLEEKDYKKWLKSHQYLSNMYMSVNTPLGNQVITRGSFIGQQRKFRIGEFNVELSSERLDVQNRSIWDVSKDYENTSYLWGGKSSFGIDCSGLTQAVFRLFYIELPRDVSQQIECGENISFENKQEGDLGFFYGSTDKVTHVGIIGPESALIHASGFVRIDKITTEGIWNDDRGIITHKFACIRRVI